MKHVEKFDMRRARQIYKGYKAGCTCAARGSVHGGHDVRDCPADASWEDAVARAKDEYEEKSSEDDRDGVR